MRRELLPLVADEAYYLDWSKSVSLGYYDHPPMTAWLIRLFGQTPRIVPIVLTVAALLLADTARLMGYIHWRWLPALMVGTPLGFVGMVLITPDIPLLFLVFVLVAVCTSKRRISVHSVRRMFLEQNDCRLVRARVVRLARPKAGNDAGECCMSRLSASCLLVGTP